MTDFRTNRKTKKVYPIKSLKKQSRYPKSKQEKVKIHGMSKSRWRCPECGRAVGFSSKGEPYCVVHVDVKPIDLEKGSEADKKQAIELGLLEYTSKRTGKTLTFDKIHKDTGLDKSYLNKMSKSDIKEIEDMGGVKIKRT